jgi:hypothetical protein
VYQRVVDPERGDCYRAAVASLLDLPLDDVPDDLTNGFAHERYLRERRLCALHLENTGRLKRRPPGYSGSEPWDVRRLVRYDYAAGSLAVASVPSQRFPGGWHAVVVQFVLQPEGWVRVKCVHDPNPGNRPYDMQRTKIRALTFFLPRPLETA